MKIFAYYGAHIVYRTHGKAFYLKIVFVIEHKVL